MKRTKFYLIVMILNSVAFMSCSDELTNEPKLSHESNQEKVIYPKRNLSSRSMESIGEWENWEKITLASGNVVYTP